ncbi:site-specific DNA-methyltransferase [Acetobacterium bakii]|uniref:DNA methylase N-4/N-6 domain-containing protein n=1 Tax=Acetobacterium bakii TaxID=52689 RepID=A0A0L6U1R5_9FIRM|nr:site-specific DNA-methyltransferase [Acetobacterium bakii]KNZ42448.1 hypothetical protein AKG39_06710 [Acetobacterium bakii]
MIETRLTGETPDLAQDNIEKLKELFPDIVTDGKIDFDKLKQDLGDYVDDSAERYNFSWNGKGQALRLAQTPSTGTLRPCKEESKDWDTTENLYIEGDNLEVLKLLQKSYHNMVKMIYIDPPYNTGKDFVYPDNFKDSIENYKSITGQTDSEGKNISNNSETSGRYHTDWLNMMYPRLRLARNLLTDDGVIFISIDENEVDNLKKLCNEVLGEDNFIGQITALCNPKGRSQDKYIANCHDYLVIYSKISLAKGDLSIGKNDDEIDSDYNLEDENGLFRELELRNTHREFGKHNRPNLYYPFYVSEMGDISFSKNEKYKNIVFPNWEDGFEGCWTWGLEKANSEKNLLVAKHVRGRWKIYRKAYANIDGEGPLKQMKSIWTDKKYHTEKGQSIFNDLFNTKDKIFQAPKSIDLIIDCIKMSQLKSGIVLDFFSGSATAAHAVMQLNAVDEGNRKFIMVQLPEPTDKNSEAAKAGYDNICEIGKERIRRAGEKIKEEKGLLAQNLDIGFKVLKLDTSNIRKWHPKGNDLEASLLDAINNYVVGRTELDIVYEIMLKFGLDLTYSVEEFIIEAKKVYSIGFGVLMICLDNDITTSIAKGILEKVQALAPETTRVVFKDNGFKTDSNKTNIKEILKCGGIDEFITL